MRIKSLLTGLIFFLVMACATTQNRAWSPPASFSFGCPYSESEEYWASVETGERCEPGVVGCGTITVRYYFKCRYVSSDPEWDMFIRHNSRGTYKIAYTRETKAKHWGKKSVDTYVYATSEYKMLDGGNTSTNEPEISFLSATK